MFDTIKRWMGAQSSAAAGMGNERTLAAWAKEEGLQFKTVSGATGGIVIDTPAGWRVERGPSQRPYFSGSELRFRFDSGLPPDAQILLLTRALAHRLETDVFESFTDAMQTRVDNSLPEEMRWLAMHAKVSLTGHPTLARRFLLLSNVEGIARTWLDPEYVSALEEAATSWWTDNLVMVMTLNRGILTVRMPGDQLELNQLRSVSRLFDLAARKLVKAV